MNPQEFGEEARRIISGPDYQNFFPKPESPAADPAADPPSWLITLFRHIGDFLRWLGEFLPETSSGGADPDIRTTAGVIIALLLVATIIFIFYRLAPRIAFRRSRTGDDTVEAAAPLPDRQGLADVREAFIRGDYDRAAGLLLKAVLGGLFDKPGNHAGKAETARQLLDRIEAEPPLLDLLRSTVSLREKIHYAGRSVSPQEIEQLMQRAEAVISRGPGR